MARTLSEIYYARLRNIETREKYLKKLLADLKAERETLEADCPQSVVEERKRKFRVNPAPKPRHASQDFDDFFNEVDF